MNCFKKDQDVVCIDDTWIDFEGKLQNGPALKQIVKIHEMGFISEDPDFLYLAFYEFPTRVYKASYFRPVKKTSIESLRKIALDTPNKTKTRELEDA